jgi:hypothetical protein
VAVALCDFAGGSDAPNFFTATITNQPSCHNLSAVMGLYL